MIRVDLWISTVSTLTCWVNHSIDYSRSIFVNIVYISKVYFESEIILVERIMEILLSDFGS